MEMRDSVCLPASVMELVTDFGGVTNNEASGLVCDDKGDIISVDESARMEALPGACEFMRNAVARFSSSHIAICTSQSEASALLSLANLFPKNPALVEKLKANLFFQQNKVNNPATFRTIAVHLGIRDNSEVVFIDDKLTAIISALKAGYGYAILVAAGQDYSNARTVLKALSEQGDFPNVSPTELDERVFLVSSIQAITFPKRG